MATASTTIQPTPTPTPRQPSSSPHPQSLQYAIISGIAGGLAGCIAKTSVAPLDRVKILFQTRSPDYQRYAGTWLGVFRAGRDIYAETGIRGLLQGHSATLLRIFPYAAIKYASYDKIHHMLMPTAASETSGRRFLAGSLAGVTSALLTYPLELIRVRLAFETPHSSTDGQRSSLSRTIKQIYLEPPLPLKPPPRPTAPSALSSTIPKPSPPSSPPIPTTPSLTHFYRGIFPTIIGIIPYAGTSFLMWGFLKKDLVPKRFSAEFRSKHKSAIDLIAGGISGALGQTAAYPLDIVRRRMQVGPALRDSPPLPSPTSSTRTSTNSLSSKLFHNTKSSINRPGFIQTAQQVYALAGWKGFFVGLSIGYLKVIPMNAVSFASWEALKVVFGLDAEETGVKAKD